MVHDAGRHPGTDALNDPAGQILQDFHGALGHQPLQKLRLKLLAVALVGAPFAGDQQPLPHCRQRDGANHSHRLSPADGQAQHSISVFIILIHHRTDGSM